MEKPKQIETPIFKNEAEEADWWDANSGVLLDAFKEAEKDGTLGQGTLKKRGLTKVHTPTPEDTMPDWGKKCIVCGETPVMPITEMCGPCTTGEADTAGGNW